jgi:hypothetical protein
MFDQIQDRLHPDELQGSLHRPRTANDRELIPMIARALLGAEEKADTVHVHKGQPPKVQNQ